MGEEQVVFTLRSFRDEGYSQPLQLKTTVASRVYETDLYQAALKPSEVKHCRNQRKFLP